MARYDRKIIEEISLKLAAGLDDTITGVYAKYPDGMLASSYPFIVITRLNANDINRFIRHLDLLINIVSDDPSGAEALDISEKIGDILEDWYRNTRLDIMGEPTLNNVEDSDDRDTRVSAQLDFQMDYLEQ